MDYEKGLIELKRYAEGTEWYADFALYEARLRENLQQEQRYGSDEQSRSSRMRVIDALNRLTNEHLKQNFNDLCRASTAKPQGCLHYFIWYSRACEPAKPYTGDEYVI